MCLCAISTSSSAHPLDSIAGLLDLSLFYHLWISATFLLFTWYITLLLFRIFVTEVCVACFVFLRQNLHSNKTLHLSVLQYKSQINIKVCNCSLHAFVKFDLLVRGYCLNLIHCVISMPPDHCDHHKVIQFVVQFK